MFEWNDGMMGKVGENVEAGHGGVLFSPIFQ
jgi:hypothetical protein